MLERRAPWVKRATSSVLDLLAALAPCVRCGTRPARADGCCTPCASRGWRAHRDGDVLSLGGYRDGVGDVVRAAKFGGAMRLLDLVGAALGDGLLDAAPVDASGAPPWLVPVPSHPRRRAARGDDPSLRIARAMAIRADAGGRRFEVVQALTRRVVTAPQSTLPSARREANVEGAFVVAPHFHARLATRSVVLVDDVLTSGATARAAAAAVRDAGAVVCLVAVAAVAGA